ncbi:hypothetical protein PspLS_11487 [Pyricularia sp. CBS 133598]|nr:hypothetical protein PspLS_11487 [Pyricularia sp. CBS 133598]
MAKTILLWRWTSGQEMKPPGRSTRRCLTSTTNDILAESFI